ncbi:hypothetical protein MNBD_GAMMA03-1012 [hydrothermal vent metagenome]|uniref:Uncharacterized protein n=1 Tax=hydrothermal vent metagenome TaxID=652676 RepID=A0A3B0VUJ5_9ZZZZ
MKNLTLKGLFIVAVTMGTMNLQAANTYQLCIEDGKHIIDVAVKEGSDAAEAVEQKVDVATCMSELSQIEAKYVEQSVGLNPSSVMTPTDRAKWAALFDAVDAKQYKGVRYLQAVYYR